MKVVQPVITSNIVPFLQMRSVGSHSKSGREKEGKKERMGKDLTFIKFISMSYMSKQIAVTNLQSPELWQNAFSNAMNQP